MREKKILHWETSPVKKKKQKKQLFPLFYVLSPTAKHFVHFLLELLDFNFLLPVKVFCEAPPTHEALSIMRSPAHPWGSVHTARPRPLVRLRPYCEAPPTREASFILRPPREALSILCCYVRVVYVCQKSNRRKKRPPGSWLLAPPVSWSGTRQIFPGKG